MRFRNKLTDDQFRYLHETINDARLNSKQIKFDIESVRNVLYDYQQLLAEYMLDEASRKGIKPEPNSP